MQIDQVPPAPQTRFRFPAITTICCHDIIGRDFSSPHSQLAFPGQIPLSTQVINASVAHLDADCPNTRRCQQKEIAFYIAITYCVLKGCSCPTHAAHQGVKHGQLACRAVWGRKEHPDIFRTKHCNKKTKSIYCLKLHTAHLGGRNAAGDPTSSHHRTSFPVQSLLLQTTPTAESSQEIKFLSLEIKMPNCSLVWFQGLRIAGLVKLSQQHVLKGSGEAVALGLSQTFI